MINWIIKKFDELTVHELYALLQLRNEVFAVEQNCVYPDMDNKDQPAFHLMGWQDGKLLAYTRLLPPGTACAEPSIGRVVTSPAARGSGAGRALMQRSIDVSRRLFGPLPIKIGAQLYLHRFYSSLGFKQTSDVYLEYGIEHIEMLLA
ncbi:MAG: GNAT family N-acetyltransferase [Bacteroidetes bacterium]|nr:GNAT family N-acetyltransferase [Bacteroidota bacterium]